VQMCTLLYTTFTHFSVSQSVLRNQFTELRPSEITLMNRVDQSQGLKLSQNHRISISRSPQHFVLWDLKKYVTMQKVVEHF
jgi:hypothetical protein